MLRQAEPVAYGLLGLRPWDLDRLTLAELDTLREWAEWREDRQWSLAAWVCANLMNATGNFKKEIQPDRLLGPHFKARQEARMRRLQRRDDEEDGG